jgi:hypothetical protein
VLKALAKDPDKRYNTVLEFLKELELAAGPESVITPLAAPPRVALDGRVPRRSMQNIWFAIGLALGLLLMVLFLLGRSAALCFVVIITGAVTLTIMLTAMSTTASKRYRNPAYPEASPIDAESRTIETTPYSSSLATSGQTPNAMAWLLFLNGTDRGSQFRLVDTVIIGRDPVTCDVIVDHPTASGRLARIQLQDNQFWIYDLTDTKSILVNGIQILAHELQERDEIRIGNTIMLFVQTEAQRRLKDFDSVWDHLTRSVRHD